MRVMVFPAAFMANTFAMMLVMIGLSLFGKPELAADVGIIHGATVALFYSFSGNARSLVLADSNQINSAVILRLRLILLLPLGVLACLLCMPVVSTGWVFVLLMVLRRSTEWVAEVFLSEQELNRRHALAVRSVVVQALLTLLLLLALLCDEAFARPLLILWALSPLLACLCKADAWRMAGVSMPLLAGIRLLLPHFGSTVVIGVSVYMFRLFILLVADKQVAGDLFSAFALGGIMGAIFSQALGPTIVHHERQGVRDGGLQKAFRLLLLALVLGGLLIILIAWQLPHWFEWTQKSQIFWSAVGCSLVGGVVMVLAQRIRLRILQSRENGDVFGSDMLSNVLLVSCIPFLFYGIGVWALSFLYLVGALLSWIFYASERRGLLLSIESGRWLNQRRVLLLIAVALCFPLFFQFGGGVFDDPALGYRSGGGFDLLPIPFAVVACYLGIVLLGVYSEARLALLSLFFIFIGMLFSSLLLGLSALGTGQQKLVLLFQYLLPMFALVLGQQFGNREDGLVQLARAAQVVVLAVVPLQLLNTLLQAQLVLSPSVYFYSIYQHLLYVPVLFVGFFLLSLFTRWGEARQPVILGGMSALMGAYVVLSWSALASGLLLFGVGCFMAQQMVLGGNSRALLALAGLMLGGAMLATVYLHWVWPVEDVMLLPEAIRGGRMQEGGVSYVQTWAYYVDGIGANWNSLFLGHEQAPARDIHPSALNYYVDFVYNFGLLGVMPLVLLVLYSLILIGAQWRVLAMKPALTGLALVVLFLLLPDNMFKVGLRQPYSGVVMFFLWGVLLAEISGSAKRYALDHNDKG